MASNSLVLTVAQFRALGNGTLPASAKVTLADSGGALAGLSVSEIASLAAKGIDNIDATNNMLTLSVAQYLALGNVPLNSGDTITLTGTGAALAGLSVAQLAALAGKGIDRLDATDNVLVDRI